jgi:hypothetical protein
MSLAGKYALVTGGGGGSAASTGQATSVSGAETW